MFAEYEKPLNQSIRVYRENENISLAVFRQRHEKRGSQIVLTVGQEVAPLCKLYKGSFSIAFTAL